MSKFALFGFFVVLFVVQITAERYIRSPTNDVENKNSGLDSEQPQQFLRKSGGRKGRKIDEKTKKAIQRTTSLDGQKCQREGGKLNCCMNVNIPPLGVSDAPGCLQMGFDQNKKSMGMSFRFNNRELLKNEVSGNDIPPMCAPLPRWPVIRICTKFHGTQMTANGMRFCMTMEARFQDTVFYRLPFDCMSYGINGISPMPNAPPAGPAGPVSPSRSSKN